MMSCDGNVITCILMICINLQMMESEPCIHSLSRFVNCLINQWCSKRVWWHIYIWVATPITTYTVTLMRLLTSYALTITCSTILSISIVTDHTTSSSIDKVIRYRGDSLQVYRVNFDLMMIWFWTAQWDWLHGAFITQTKFITDMKAQQE